MPNIYLQHLQEKVKFLPKKSYEIYFRTFVLPVHRDS